MNAAEQRRAEQSAARRAGALLRVAALLAASPALWGASCDPPRPSCDAEETCSDGQLRECTGRCVTPARHGEKCGLDPCGALPPCDYGLACAEGVCAEPADPLACRLTSRGTPSPCPTGTYCRQFDATFLAPRFARDAWGLCVAPVREGNACTGEWSAAGAGRLCEAGMACSADPRDPARRACFRSCADASDCPCPSADPDVLDECVSNLPEEGDAVCAHCLSNGTRIDEGDWGCCEGPLRGVAGQCCRGAGARCASDAECCADSICSDGTCVAPPAIVRAGGPLVELNAVRVGPSTLDYLPGVRIAAGAVTAAGLLRIAYVDTPHAGAPSDSAEHELWSVAVSTAPESLGELVGEPTRLVARPPPGARLHGLLSTQLRDAAGRERPLMVAVVEPLGAPQTYSYLLVDHDPETGIPFTRSILGVPRSAPVASDGFVNDFHRLLPGIAAGELDGETRILMSLVVAGTEPADVSLVVGFVEIGPTTVRFREVDRSAIPRMPLDDETRPRPFESVPLAWHPGLRQWIVASVVGTVWEGRFQLVSWEGRFHRAPGEGPAPTLWRPPDATAPHTVNHIAVHPVSGHVAFQSGHNTVSGTVTTAQVFVNQWDDLYPTQTGTPPETFPVPMPRPMAVARQGHWLIAPSLFGTTWEYSESGVAAGAAHGRLNVVQYRTGGGGGAGRTLVDPLFTTALIAGEGLGVHHVARVTGRGVGAHVAIVGVDDALRRGLVVAFVEDDHEAP